MRLTYGGSSPLTRGKLCLGRPAHALIGLIPAHAGKTFLQPSMLPNSPGSSPLTRGKLAASEARALQIGLIPAHAGKTTKTETPPPSARAHPRSRGENGVSPIADDCGPGSSPLTRGKQGEAVSGSQTRRLIPAHAGKTQRARTRLACRGAHPRSRGENTYDGHPTMTAHGSSPLTRGKLR